MARAAGQFVKLAFPNPERVYRSGPLFRHSRSGLVSAVPLDFVPFFMQVSTRRNAGAARAPEIARPGTARTRPGRAGGREPRRPPPPPPFGSFRNPSGAPGIPRRSGRGAARAPLTLRRRPRCCCCGGGGGKGAAPGLRATGRGGGARAGTAAAEPGRQRCGGGEARRAEVVVGGGGGGFFPCRPRRTAAAGDYPRRRSGRCRREGEAGAAGPSVSGWGRRAGAARSGRCPGGGRGGLQPPARALAAS